MDEYLDNYLAHHGIKGQRWGIRRYQNEDGTLTAEGKARQKNGESRLLDSSGNADKIKKVAKYAAIGAGAVALTAATVYVAKNSDVKRKFDAIVDSVKSAKVKELPEIKNIKKSRAEDAINRMALSDKELQDRIKRLESEKRLKALSDEALHPGRVYMMNVLKQTGNKALPMLGAGMALYGAKALVEGKFDRKEFAKALFEGGPKKK
jgi:hypothetical protein